MFSGQSATQKFRGRWLSSMSPVLNSPPLSSTMMSQTEPAYPRTPVEIWRETFHYVLGPSLSNPIHTSLLGYESYLLRDDESLLQLHAHRDRQRNTLRLVAGSWKLVADQMGDQLVFIHPTGFQIPPDYPITNAEHIYYLEFYSDLPVHLGLLSDEEEAEYENVSAQSWTNYLLNSVKTDKLSQQTSQTILPTATAYLRSGGSHRPSECYWIERLAQESFKSLVALEILVFTYSQFLRTPLLHLPILRFLHLDTGGGYSEYLTQWRLPRLQYVHLHFSANSTAYVDEQRAISYCVDGLPRLNTYVIGSFLSVIAGLSQLDALLQTFTSIPDGSI